MTSIKAQKSDVQRQVNDHWRRFRRLMLLMTLIALATISLAAWRLHAEGVPFHLHFVIAMGGGIFIALLLAGALIGLAFVSNRSGHDSAVSDLDE
jgi:polyferredoxin